MLSYSATDAKQNFAALLDAAATQPVVIRRHERDVAMVISPEEYARLHRFNVDQLMALCAQASAEAEASGLTDETLAQLLADD